MSVGDAEPALAGANPFLVETSSELQLQFAKSVLQSRMRLDDPDALVAPYTRQMMSFLLFNPEPSHILMIGLGGGSLAKFCYRHLPHAKISVVEIDARVIAMRDSFRVPPDDARFRVIHDDGVRYVSRMEHTVDAILIDAFDENGVAPVLADSDFYANAWRRLDDEGVLVMNLLGAPGSYEKHLEQVKQVADRALLVSVTGNDNVLLLAFKPGVIEPNAAQLPLRARYLQSRFRLNFRHYLHKIREGSALV
jgi:spermidine synthase